MQALKKIVINGAMSLALLFGLTVASTAADQSFEEVKALAEKDDSLSQARLAYESYRAELESGERKRWDVGALGFDIDTEIAISNERTRKARATRQAILEYQNNQPNPKIGMDKSRIKYGTNWGSPEYINTTIDAKGSHEQWVYRGNRYLYFDNNKLTSIQY